MFTALLTALTTVMAAALVPLGLSWLFDWLVTLL